MYSRPAFLQLCWLSDLSYHPRFIHFPPGLWLSFSLRLCFGNYSLSPFYSIGLSFFIRTITSENKSSLKQTNKKYNSCPMSILTFKAKFLEEAIISYLPFLTSFSLLHSFQLDFLPLFQQKGFPQIAAIFPKLVVNPLVSL